MSDEITQAVGAPLERHVRPRAWASSAEWRGNQLLSAAQYDNCLLKNRADFDVPLYDQTVIDAAVAAERERCAKLCDVARAAVWPYHDAEVFKVAQTVCENLANRIRGIGA